MLAIISDLHLTDGSTSTTIHPSAFDLLRQEIEAAARTNGAGKGNVRTVHLLLLGDIFDLVRTDWWFRRDASGRENAPWESRPWNGDLDPETAMNRDSVEVGRQYDAILRGILDHPSTKGFIDAIKGLATSDAVPELQITYVIGNHDRALNNFPGLQQTIQAALTEEIALKGNKVEFKPSFTDPAYAVAARHGHEWEDNCHARLLLQKVLQKRRKWDPLDPAINRVQNLGEVITSELMSGLVWRVRQADDPDLTDIVKHADLLRPATDVFQWIEWQARSRKLKKSQKELLAQSLSESIAGVVDSAFGRLWDRATTDLLVSGDLVDRLELVRSRLRASGYDGLRKCVKLLVLVSNFASAVAPGKAEDYQGAKEEFKRLDPGIQYLVYGHTHRARHDHLSGTVDGRVQMYLNTGTYLPLLETTDDGKGFAQSSQM
ncbi:MAG: hypothetical protein KDM81_06630, partial [Verrucomicrobiae bacterium]|nr:hypothetical protein [Verrucomicrobiae bacterium]